MANENSIAKKALSDAKKLDRRTDMRHISVLRTSNLREARSRSFSVPELSELGAYINDIYKKLSDFAILLGMEYDDKGDLIGNSYKSHSHTYEKVTVTTTTTEDEDGNTTTSTSTTTETTTTSGVN